MEFGYSVWLIRHLGPRHRISHRNSYGQVHQTVQQSRIDDCAYTCCLATLMLGDVDDRAGSDPHAEQHDTHRHAWFAPVRGGLRSWRAGNRREMHAVLA